MLCIVQVMHLVGMVYFNSKAYFCFVFLNISPYFCYWLGVVLWVWLLLMGDVFCFEERMFVNHLIDSCSYFILVLTNSNYVTQESLFHQNNSLQKKSAAKQQNYERRRRCHPTFQQVSKLRLTLFEKHLTFVRFEHWSGVLTTTPLALTISMLFTQLLRQY